MNQYCQIKHTADQRAKELERVESELQAAKTTADIEDPSPIPVSVYNSASKEKSASFFFFFESLCVCLLQTHKRKKGGGNLDTTI